MKDPEFFGVVRDATNKNVCQPPQAISREVLTAFEQVPIYASLAPSTEVPEWLKPLIWSREAVQERRVVLAASAQDGEPAFLFLHATQNPLAAHFLSLRMMRSTLCDFESMAADATLEAWSQFELYRFEVQPNQYVTHVELPWPADNAEVKVFQDVFFRAPGTLVCNRRWDWLRSFMLLLPWRKSGKKSETRTPKQAKHNYGSATASSTDAKLYDYGSFQTKDSHSSSDDEDATPCSSIQRAELPDDVLARVWQMLDAKRAAWATEASGHGEDFVTRIRGGKWTMQAKGVPYDSIVGQALAGLPTSWCREYQLNVVASFSYAKFGDQAASALAVEWCRRMQHFFNIWVAQPDPKYKFSLADAEGLVADVAFEEAKASVASDKNLSARFDEVQNLFPVLND